MREDEILAKVLDEADAALPTDYDVRLEGGDQDTNPPEAVIQWNASRIAGENGHTSFGSAITDNTGNKIGVEHHAYFRMNLNILVRDYDEISKDKAANDVQMKFVPYEGPKKVFDSDTTEWQVGNVGPRGNAVIEPDWYESGIDIQFKYVKRTDDTESHDTLEEIQTNVDVDESISGTNSEVRTN